MRIAAGILALSLLCCVLTQTAETDTDDESNNVLPPIGHTFFCNQYPDDCRETHAQPSLPNSSTERHRQLVAVNSAVNASIVSKTDPDQIDRNWLIAPQAGDCDDYAVTKRHELLKAGWPSAALLLAEVTLLSTGEHHLILIVKGTRANWVLDNLTDEVQRLADTRNRYAWDRIETSANPRFWTKSFAGLG